MRSDYRNIVCLLTNLHYRQMLLNERTAIAKESRAKKYVDEETRHVALMMEENEKWNHETGKIRYNCRSDYIYDSKTIYLYILDHSILLDFS